MSGESDRVGITVIVGEFVNSAKAQEAFDDLSRWISRRGKSEISAYRVGKDGSFRLVVAVVFDDSGHKDPIVRRFRRKGGWLSDIPQPDKLVLVDRFLSAAKGGLSAEQRGVPRPLAGPPGDPAEN